MEQEQSMYQLEGEYLDTYERAELYANFRNINSRVLEEMLGDLYDLLVSAQKDGRQIEGIIGSDLELFCKDYFSEYDIKARLAELPRTFFKWFLLVFIFEIVIMIMDRTSIYDARINWFPYITGISVGIVTQLFVWAVVKPLLFRFRRVRTIIYDMIILLVFVGSIILSGYLANVMELDMPAFPFIICAGVYIVIFIFVSSIINMKKYGRLKRPNSIYKRPLFSNKEQFNIDLYVEIKKQMLKRYDRKNKKHIKAGKGKLGTEAFISMIKKEIDRMPFVWKLMKVVYAILIAVPVCGNFVYYLSEGKIQSAFIDSAIMCGIMMIILVPVYRICKKNDENVMTMRLSVIEGAERYQMDLIEYLRHGYEGKTDDTYKETDDNLIKFSNY